MFYRLVQIHLEQCSLFFLRTWKVGDDARSRIGEHQVQPRKHYRMNRGKVAGVFMRGPLARSRAALQDCLWNLPDERNNEGRGTLQGCDDHTCVVHETSRTNTEGNHRLPDSRFSTRPFNPWARGGQDVASLHLCTSRLFLLNRCSPYFCGLRAE